MGHNFVSGLFCTLKTKKLKKPEKNSKNLGFSSPGISGSGFSFQARHSSLYPINVVETILF